MKQTSSWEGCDFVNYWYPFSAVLYRGNMGKAVTPSRLARRKDGPHNSRVSWLYGVKEAKARRRESQL